jgi:hypothetical protein
VLGPVKLIKDKGDKGKILRGYVHLTPGSLSLAMLFFYMPGSAIRNENRLYAGSCQVQKFRLEPV